MMIIPIFQMRKLKNREVKKLAPNHPVGLESRQPDSGGPAFHDDVILPLQERNKVEHMSDSCAVDLEASASSVSTVQLLSCVRFFGTP